MNGQQQLSGLHRTGRFFLCGWVMLMVVLLSAAPSSAGQRNRSVGSAFDPFSASVVVRPTQGKAAVIATSLDRRKAPEPGAGGQMEAPSRYPLAHATSSSKAGEALTGYGVRLATDLIWPAHSPRAPPEN